MTFNTSDCYTPDFTVNLTLSMSKASLAVRALQDLKGGVVVRRDDFLLINMNTVESGEITGIATIDFHGDDIPTGNDLTHDIFVQGQWTSHPKHGQQFAVAAWAPIEDSPSPTVRIKTRRLSPEELKRLRDDK